MRPRLLVACVVAAASPVRAAPAADVVVCWSPTPLGPVGDAIADVASRAGASYVDASPEAIPVPDPRPLIRRGIQSYSALEFDAAITALDSAAEIVDQTGAAFVDATTLGDLFLHRAMAHTQRSDDTRAWDDLVVTAAIDPTRTLDPAGFAPRVVERFAQARAQLAATPRARVKLVGPAGCQVRIDGAPVAATDVELVFGKHWLEATCNGRAPIRLRLGVDRAALEVPIAGAEIKPPDDAALLIQARSAAARAMIAVTIQARTAVIRRIAVSGREQDRISVPMQAGREARDVAAAVGKLLQPVPVAASTPWYRSRWLWGAGGAVVAAAILIPFVARDTGAAPSLVLAPENVSPEWNRK